MLRSQPYPYNFKGFRQTLTFSLAFCAATGLLTWLAAAESIECNRNPAGKISCSLTREPGGYPLPPRSLERVTCVRRLTHRSDDDDDSYSLVLSSPAGELESVTVDDQSEIDTVTAEIKAFFNNPAAPTLETGLSGRPGALRTILFWAFLGGVSIMPLWFIGLIFPSTRGPMPTSVVVNNREPS